MLIVAVNSIIEVPKTNSELEINAGTLYLYSVLGKDYRRRN